MKTLVHEKIKIAREALGISQTLAGTETGWSQSAVSLLEKGELTYVPDAYLSFMVSQGINLMALYDPAITADDFRTNPFYRMEKQQAIQNCNDCACTKENILLKENIVDLRAMLRKDYNRGEASAANG